MITIELQTGVILRMNLKDSHREKELRAAWYSMSDIPHMLDKVLKIKADSGNTYELKVREIKNCEYDPIPFDYCKPERTEPKRTTPVQPKRYENSVVPPQIDSSLPEIIHKILEAASEIIGNLPEKAKQNISLFIQGLYDAHVPFIPTNEELMEIATAALHADTPEEVSECVRRYLDTWQKLK